SARAAALSAVLANRAAPCAIVNVKGELYHIDPHLKELRNHDVGKEQWWRDNGSIQLKNGDRYKMAVSRLQDGLTLVTFEATGHK
ncbi:MAG: hypothetical protein JOZ38_11945, partial [Candidatus Eremiobacteraeota bacterium]|nr:hypothetical protein [Candidatus Eremiobacteraeota bacterium]